MTTDQFEIPEELDDFFGDIEREVLDPATAVSFSFTNGEFMLPIEEPMPLEALLFQNNVLVSQGTTYFVEGREVPGDIEVAPGAVISAVGTAKAG